MLAIFTKGWVNGYNRDGRAVAGYYRKASPGTEQRAFDFYASKPVRPGTTREQRDAGQAGAADLLGWAARRVGASVLRSRFPRDFHDAGHVRLIGQHVETALDVAAVAQVCRDPRFETLRILFCSPSGDVIGQSAVTSRLPAILKFSDPGQAGAVMAHLDTLASQYQASHYWLVHNHPNGSATPSNEDVAMTKAIADRIPGFAGHVVINSHEYATIDRRGHVTLRQRDFDTETYEFAPGEGLGENIYSAAKLADYAKTLQMRPDWVTVVSVTNGLTHTISEYPEAVMAAGGRRARIKALAMLRRLARGSGADNGLMMVVRGDVRAFRDFVASGLVVDVVNAETERTLRQIDKAIKPGPVWALGGKTRAYWSHEGGTA